MPIKYSIENNIIIMLDTGKLSILEIEQVFQQLNNDQSFAPYMKVLALNEKTSFHITTSEAREIGRIMTSLKYRFSRFALVVESVFHYGLGRMVQAYYELRGSRFRVFRDKKKAVLWLNIAQNKNSI